METPRISQIDHRVLSQIDEKDLTKLAETVLIALIKSNQNGQIKGLEQLKEII